MSAVKAPAQTTRRPVAWIAGLALVLAAAFGVRTLVRGIARGPSVFRPKLATEFFARYVEGDGRVVRRDQGSDTVSEGQGYAMLLAVALDDGDEFKRVWQWTRNALQRPDGLVSWHWVGGRVVDPQPASDADIDIAHALLLAAERFGDPTYVKEARRIADAILAHETILVGGERVLTAGPWAREQRVVNPSYMAPDAFLRFADAFGDDRWRDVLRSGVTLTERLISNGESLPPDWARVAADGGATPITRPNGDGAPSSGLDAARVPVRFASGCDDHARRVAEDLRTRASEWTAADRHPVEIVAAAASAHAAGDDEQRDTLLMRAERTLRERPSYYGWAWVALGRAMLDPRAISSCSAPGFASGGA